jgi:hypothetical protein
VSGGERVAAEKVVLATPWSVTSRLIQTSELSDAFPLADRWGDMPTSPITGIHLWLDRDIMQDNQVAIVGLLPQWLFRRPVKTENAAGECYYQVVVSASHDVRGLEPTTLVAMVMSDLASVARSQTSEGASVARGY